DLLLPAESFAIVGIQPGSDSVELAQQASTQFDRIARQRHSLTSTKCHPVGRLDRQVGIVENLVADVGFGTRALGGELGEDWIVASAEPGGVWPCQRRNFCLRAERKGQ